MQRLEATELKRRIDAARTLRGFKQAELAKRLADDGHPAYHIGEVERGNMALSGTLRRSLAHHLQVDEAWFTEPNVDQLIGHADTDTGEPAGAGLEERLVAIEQAVEARTRHERIIAGMLERQTAILTRIEALMLALPSDAQTEELLGVLRDPHAEARPGQPGRRDREVDGPAIDDRREAGG